MPQRSKKRRNKKKAAAQASDRSYPRDLRTKIANLESDEILKRARFIVPAHTTVRAPSSVTPGIDEDSDTFTYFRKAAEKKNRITKPEPKARRQDLSK